MITALVVLIGFATRTSTPSVAVSSGASVTTTAASSASAAVGSNLDGGTSTFGDSSKLEQAVAVAVKNPNDPEALRDLATAYEAAD